jgi:hypothetical protein
VISKSRTDYRYERKFRTTSHSLNELTEIVRSSTGMFSEIYPSRIVNSIYLDTREQDFCSDNLAGISTRIKPRIRWYGPRHSSIDNSKLELKYKVNLIGTKAFVPFPPFSLGASFYKDMTGGLSSLYDGFPTLDFLKELEPSLLITYQRRYFSSFDRQYRITIDWNLQYYPYSLFGPTSVSPIEDDAIVLELKYSADVVNPDWFIDSLPFRFTKSSKYVVGILHS